MVYGILACCCEENYRHNVRRSLNSIKNNFKIQKLINDYEKGIKIRLNYFMNDRLPYYYEPFVHNEYNKYAKTEIYDSKLDYEIRHYKPVNHFYIGRFIDWDSIRSYMFNHSNKMYTYCGLEPDLLNFDNLLDDFKITINKIEDLINKFSTILCGNWDASTDPEETKYDNMVNNLSIICDNDIHNRYVKEYTLRNEIEPKTFKKIFKCNRKINPKPYYEMKEYIKEYVLRKKKEMDNLLEEYF